MKFTRSFPANAIARENVPSKTIILNTLILHQWRTCMINVKIKKDPIRIAPVLMSIHSFSSGVIIVRSFIPFRSMK